jgi:hypothetical protein
VNAPAAPSVSPVGPAGLPRPGEAALGLLASSGGFSGGLSSGDSFLLVIRDEVSASAKLAKDPARLHPLLEAAEEAFLALPFLEVDLQVYLSLSVK